MTLKNINKLEKNVVELEIEVDAETFEKAIEGAYKKNVDKINVQGFRKGKAPKKIIERMYGESVFFEDAINDSYPIAYSQAVKEAGIEPIDRADIEVVNVGKEGYTFKAKATVKPEVKVSGYKGVKAEKVIYTVTDEDVSNEIERVRQRNARLVSVEGRPAQNGDTAVIDYEGFVDGVPFDGGKGEKHNLKLGSGQFIPGFEEQLIDKNVGDDIEVSVTFPEEYQEKSLAGKSAVFKVKINELKFNELPLLDDEFAKDASEFNTLGEYTASIRAKMQESKDNQSQNEVEEKLIDEVLKNMEVEIPEVMIERQIDNIASDYDNKMKQQGLDIETYLKYTGSDMEQFRKMFREQGERQVKVRLALEEIARLESIPVSDEEINEELMKIAEAYKMDIEKIKEYIPQEDLARDIVVGKAVELIKSNAEVTEVLYEDKKQAGKTQEDSELNINVSQKKSTKKSSKKAEDAE